MANEEGWGKIIRLIVLLVLVAVVFFLLWWFYVYYAKPNLENWGWMKSSEFKQNLESSPIFEFRSVKYVYFGEWLWSLNGKSWYPVTSDLGKLDEQSRALINQLKSYSISKDKQKYLPDLKTGAEYIYAKSGESYYSEHWYQNFYRFSPTMYYVTVYYFQDDSMQSYVFKNYESAEGIKNDREMLNTIINLYS